MKPYSNPRKGFFFAFILVGVLALGGAVMGLWNWLMPTIFGLPPITYWQAMGLFVLSRILMGGFHFRGRSEKFKRFDKSAFKERFMHLSDEERRQFKEQWQQRCNKS